MDTFLDSDSLPLIVVNVLLGLGCLAAVGAVAVAAWLDVRERRRWRAMVPPCWPPPGVTLEEAEAASTPKKAPRAHEEKKA